MLLLRPAFDFRNQPNVSFHGEMREQADILDYVPDATPQANDVDLRIRKHHSPRSHLPSA